MSRPTEAFVSNNLFELGLGYVVLARFRGGKAEAGGFLLDVHCLGVKNAFFAQTTEADYEKKVLDRVLPADNRKAIDPPSARKLVEGTVAYAMALGFPPHADYKMATRVFGGTKAADSTETFTFGKNGKPFFVQSPSDSFQKTLRILKQLRMQCGEDGFEFMGLGSEAEISELERAGIKIRQKVSAASENSEASPPTESQE